MIKLPCDNLKDFVVGIKHFYTVYEGNYQLAQTVILYCENWQEKFEVIHIIRHEGNTVLGLKYKGVRKN